MELAMLGFSNHLDDYGSFYTECYRQMENVGIGKHVPYELI